MRTIMVLLLLLIAFGDTALAGPWGSDFDAVSRSDGSSTDLGRWLSKAIPWLCIVVILPILLLRWCVGAHLDTQLSDEEWAVKYPYSVRKDSDRKTGFGQVLISLFLIGGYGMFWLLFVSPSAFKWLFG